MQNMHEWDVYCIVRSEELGVRSGGRGAQLIKRPNTPFYNVSRETYIGELIETDSDIYEIIHIRVIRCARRLHS